MNKLPNWLNLVAPVAEVGGVRVDGAPVTAAWNAIGASGYAFATTRANVIKFVRKSIGCYQDAR